MVRLERGGADFLVQVVGAFAEIGEMMVLSPALYPGSTRVWARAGFEEYLSLLVMERALVGAIEPVKGVIVTQEPSWEEIHRLDEMAFEGFWGMSRTGLEEAFATSRASAVLSVREQDRLAGYALLGTQWGVTYLHRIAVHPDLTGRGHGKRLLQASMGWGRGAGGRTMLLNVRHENVVAQNLYRRLGFVDADTDLHVLRHLLN
jgi:ribosomal-protein-alanine N-acetyltransferase